MSIKFNELELPRRSNDPAVEKGMDQRDQTGSKLRLEFNLSSQSLSERVRSVEHWMCLMPVSTIFGAGPSRQPSNYARIQIKSS